jgi:hypothetical protein
MAGVKVFVNPKDPAKVKYASAHDSRRAFGVLWAARLMPAQLMELMRRESIETILRFDVGTDAERTAEAVWAAFEAVQRVFLGRLLTVLLTVGGTVDCPRAACGRNRLIVMRRAVLSAVRSVRRPSARSRRLRRSYRTTGQTP